MSREQLYLMIGNSRLHWAWYDNGASGQFWHTPHLTQGSWSEALARKYLPIEIQHYLRARYSLWIASVVPEQTQVWQDYPLSKMITLTQIPLRGLYAGMGVDRALASLGAGQQFGFPCLVIDAGTALTLTAFDPQQHFWGGAILPGIQLQFRMLSQKTSALPLVETGHSLPQRWAKSTSTAIASGIFYTLLAGIRDYMENWLTLFTDGTVTITGGDADLLIQYFAAQYPELSPRLICDRNIIFSGMRAVIDNK